MYRPLSQKYYTKEEAAEKAKAFCNYQERTQEDVRAKLISLGISGKELEEIIIDLCHEKYIDEERFAKAFVRGKYGLKKWGRKRITLELKRKKLSTYCITQGIKEIDPEQYWNNLLGLAEKKYQSLSDKNLFVKQQKVIQFLNYKGYEQDLIEEALQQVINQPSKK